MVNNEHKINYTEYHSPNFGVRPEKEIIDTIVIHYTVSDYNISHNIFMATNSVSPHYMINDNGQIVKYVDEQYRAWHAGVSYWNGENKRGKNDDSIGIELVNPGSGEQGCFATPFEDQLLSNNCQKHIFPDIQIASLINLIHNITEKYNGNITKQNIIGHGDISIGRKIDPGVMFPWHKLAENQIGLYYNDFNKISNSNRKIVIDKNIGHNLIESLCNKLKIIGYKPCNHYEYDNEFANLIRAFQLHYQQDSNHWGIVDEQLIYIADDLVGQIRGAEHHEEL